MAEESTEAQWVIRNERARDSITALLDRDTHQHFIAYLQLRRRAGQEGRLTRLKPDWASLGELLEVPGSPAGKPYLRPFWKGKRDAQQEWLNKNLAGSFSPSSLRRSAREVIDVDADGLFSLPPRHWIQALRVFLYEQPMQVKALAGFLFRDYALLADGEPSSGDLVDAFRTEFDYRTEDDDEFNYLYRDDWPHDGTPWFERL